MSTLTAIQPEDTRSTLYASIDHPQIEVRDLKYEILLRRYSLSCQGPNAIRPLASAISSLSLCCVTDGYSHSHCTPKQENYGDPSDKLLSVHLARADKSDKELSESRKGDTEGILVSVCRRTIFILVPLTRLKYLRLVSSLLRRRRFLSRAIRSRNRAQATHSFFSSRRSDNSPLSPVALPSPSHPGCQARIFNHQPWPSM